jgi:hypothetical protein
MAFGEREREQEENTAEGPRYQDAERDCTTALSFSPRNVKALYRRALSRRGMGRVDEALVGESTTARCLALTIELELMGRYRGCVAAGA